MFVADKPPWSEISDGLPEWDAWPTEFEIESTEHVSMPSALGPTGADNAARPASEASADAYLPTVQVGSTSLRRQGGAFGDLQ